MTVTIGSLTFRGDELYLHLGDHQLAAVSEETPEGHVLRFNAQGGVLGLTMINAKWLLERDHVINVTVPEYVAVSPDTLRRHSPQPDPASIRLAQRARGVSQPDVWAAPHSAAQTPLNRTQSGPIHDRPEGPNRQ